MTLPCKFRQVGVEGQSELSVGSAGVELGKQGLPGECLVRVGRSACCPGRAVVAVLCVLLPAGRGRCQCVWPPVKPTVQLSVRAPALALSQQSS